MLLLGRELSDSNSARDNVFSYTSADWLDSLEYLTNRWHATIFYRQSELGQGRLSQHFAGLT